MSSNPKITVCDAFKAMAAAFRLDPVHLAKRILKDAAENNPNGITFHREDVEKVQKTAADLASFVVHRNQ